MPIKTYTLANFPKKKKGKILGFVDENSDFPSKMIEIGLIPETEFVILRQAILGGLLYIDLGLNQILIRKKEAHYVFVEPTNDAK